MRYLSFETVALTVILYNDSGYAARLKGTILLYRSIDINGSSLCILCEGAVFCRWLVNVLFRRRRVRACRDRHESRRRVRGHKSKVLLVLLSSGSGMPPHKYREVCYNKSAHSAHLLLRWIEVVQAYVSACVYSLRDCHDAK